MDAPALVYVRTEVSYGTALIRIRAQPTLNFWHNLIIVNKVRADGKTMKYFRSKNAARIWVFATLLAFAGQMVGVSAHAAMMIKASETVVHVMPDCHGSGDEITQKTVNSTSAQTFESCCDGDCSMMGCQAIYAVLNSIFASHPKLSLHLSYNARSSAPLQRHNSLYRPPILG